MSCRWTINRIGFINFWLYDDEVFEFSDGKLFLRGANGTGKSITTQSFIPFILDGNKSPDRLDPFGSRDRKMEYYLLGENEKEDSTAYLYLEFKKENLYRTIGIGLRAQRGKPMNFWGFIILDGRRIGYNFNLYIESGTKKIPLSKLELKNELGNENEIKDSSKEYMAAVNKNIFGFQKLEQYDQFIKLLIKVRAPKLSKDLKPIILYDILNQSLQTIPDDDLRPMVESMEKMDGMQFNLEELQLAYKSISAIEKEYNTYNCFILKQKSKAYAAIRDKVNTQRDKLENMQTELKEEKNTKLQKSAENEDLRMESEKLKQQKETLKDVDLENAINKLENAKSNQKDFEQEINEISETIESYTQNINYYESQLKTQNDKLDYTDNEIDKIIQELAEINADLKFDDSKFSKENTISDRALILNIKRNLKQYTDMIYMGLESIEEFEKIEKQYEFQQSELEICQSEYYTAENNYSQLENDEQTEKDKIVESFYKIQSENIELKIPDNSLLKIVDYIVKYKNRLDIKPISSIVENIYSDIKPKLLLKKERNTKNLEDSEYQYNIELQNLNNLKSLKNAFPERSEKVEYARKILSEKGIKFMPFYQTVEFAPNLEQSKKDILEQQLKDSGMLDSLVIPYSQLEYAQKLLSNLSDTIIIPDRNSQLPKFNKLIPSDLPAEILEEVNLILKNISSEKLENCNFVLNSDGYFKNGIFEGHSVAISESQFVGILSRKKYIKKIIDEKEKICDDLKNLIAEYKDTSQQLELSLNILEKEYSLIPSFDRLDDVQISKENQSRILNQMNDELNKKKENFNNIKLQKEDANQKVIKSCKLLPFVRNAVEFKNMIDLANDYSNYISDLEYNVQQYNMCNSDISQSEYNIDREEQLIDKEDLRRKKINLNLEKCKSEIKSIEEFLNNPKIIEASNKLKSIESRLKEIQDLNLKNEKDITRLETKIEQLKRDISEKKQTVLNLADIENKLLKYYQEELQLGLVIEQHDRTALGCLKEALSLPYNIENSIESQTESLLNIYNQNINNLSKYFPNLSEYFENDFEYLRKRKYITINWNGKKLSPKEFCAVLEKAIENNKLLIQEKDKELFKEILTDTLSNKLSNLISTSQQWIENMSNMMQSIDTSMGMKFSLDWKPKKAENENELDTKELEKLLYRDKDILAAEDIERLSKHFRSKIEMSKSIAEEKGEVVSYIDLTRDILDYRKWFELKMSFQKENDTKKELTNSAFNRFSGGERAMAIYVPLFAAVSSCYKNCTKKDYPRIIALDEAFAGIDSKNIATMFELIHKLDFDYIMNSQVLWGCYESVKSLNIVELLRPSNSQIVSLIRYHWNGKRRILDE